MHIYAHIVDTIPIKIVKIDSKKHTKHVTLKHLPNNYLSQLIGSYNL